MAKATPIEGLSANTDLAIGLKRILGARMADLLKFSGRLKQLGQDAGAADEASSQEDLVHDARVATRRLRAAFGLYPFAPGDRRSDGKARLAVFGKTLGDVRDLDVSLQWLRERLDRVADEERSGVEALVLQRQQRREAATDRLRGQVATFFGSAQRSAAPCGGSAPRSTAPCGGSAQRSTAPCGGSAQRSAAPFIEEIASGLALLRAPSGRLGGGKVQRGLARRVRRADRWLELAVNGKPDFVHQLRILTKKLRYHGELLVGIVPQAEALVDAVSPLQDGLGDLHECDTRIHWLTEALTAAAAADLPGMVRLVRDAKEDRRSRWEKMQGELQHWQDKKKLLRLGRKL